MTNGTNDFLSLSDEFDKAFKQLVERHQIAAAELTERQLAEALKQALACGDFQMHVRASDNAQAITYIPYREHEQLKARIKELEAIIADRDKYGRDVT